METKKINWNRRVNRPRLTKRVKQPPSKATALQRRILSITAILRTMSEKTLTADILTQVFGDLMYYDTIHACSARERKSLPTLRKLIRLNNLADWTK